jgi:tryptophan synthase alpha subunit
MLQLDMKILTFILAVMPCTVHASQQIISHHSLMHYTRLMSEEHFSAGRPVGVVLPLAVKDSPWEEVEYLLQELHTSGRWPILVYNMSSDMKENMYSETNRQGAYIILISGPCEERMEYISRFREQVYDLSADNITGQSFNPRVKFIVSVMSNCEQKENTEFSRAILNELWLNGL